MHLRDFLIFLLLIITQREVLGSLQIAQHGQNALIFSLWKLFFSVHPAQLSWYSLDIISLGFFGWHSNISGAHDEEGKYLILSAWAAEILTCFEHHTYFSFFSTPEKCWKHHETSTIDSPELENKTFYGFCWGGKPFPSFAFSQLPYIHFFGRGRGNSGQN